METDQLYRDIQKIENKSPIKNKNYDCDQNVNITQRKDVEIINCNFSNSVTINSTGRFKFTNCKFYSLDINLDNTSQVIVENCE
ncbi:MAG: hypothetical protein ACI8Q1_001167, partial [Parvicella sp.]